MSAKFKLAIKVSKYKLERLYAVVAMFAALGGGYRLTLLPQVHARWQLPIWQFVGGILIGGVAYTIYELTGVNDAK